MSLPPQCTSTTCYSYRGQRFTEVFINYNNLNRYQYNRLVPDYFRKYYPECGFANYREALNDISNSKFNSFDFNSVALSSDGTKGITGSNSNTGIYYTSNSGVTWTQSNITTGNFNSVALSSDGTKGITGSDSNTGIYYTSDSGATWAQSNVTTGDFYSVALSSDGTKGIAGSFSGSGIYYSSNFGATWIQSNIITGNFNSVALSTDGTKGIAGSDSNTGIYYTSNFGATWTQSNIITGNFNSVALSTDGTKGITGSDSNTGIYYSSNSGITWAQSNLITGNFNSVALSTDGTKGIAGSNSNTGIYYTSDSGANWTQSNITTGNFNSVALSTDGTKGITGSNSNTGIYYTSDSGATWTQSNITTGNFKSVALSTDGTKGIVGSNSNTGIYYTNNSGATLTQGNILTISLCLRTQLRFGPIDLYSLEEIFIRIVPSINDSPADTIFKDNIRNEFIAFALNIEKSYLYYNKGLETCNNNLVPWEAVFDIATINPTTFSYQYGQNIPLTQYDQYIIYNLSMNYFDSVFSIRNTSQLNYFNIIRLALGLPIIGDLTIVNFYNLIYFSFVFLSKLFTISQTLLQGKDPGIPKQFLDLFFPIERQKYYYNLYLSWIQSRNKYLGFGDRINVSNGDGTYIRVAGL